MDRLSRLPFKDLMKLRDAYKGNLPKQIVSFNMLNNSIEWRKKDPRLDIIKFYCVNENWSNDGTFVAMGENFVHCNTLDKSCNTLKRALQLLDWRTEKTVTQVRSCLKPAFLEIARRLHLEYNFTEEHVYHTSKEEMEPEVPKGLVLKPLTLDHAKEIDKFYHYDKEDPQILEKLYIDLNPNIGLYTENDELIGWCLVDLMGTFYSLHVVDGHRGKGYSNLLAHGIRKTLQERAVSPLAIVNADNNTMIDTFSRKGFERIGSSFWFKAKLPQEHHESHRKKLRFHHHGHHSHDHENYD